MHYIVVHPSTSFKLAKQLAKPAHAPSGNIGQAALARMASVVFAAISNLQLAGSIANSSFRIPLSAIDSKKLST
jgi:hypothetical protein